MLRAVDHDFFKKWTPGMAYVLGFFAADGCMIQNNRGGHFIEFHITDKELLYDIRSVLKSNHKISVRTRDPKHKIGYRIQIGSKQMYEDLSTLGFRSRKSLDLDMPQIPKKYFGHFVRGYFDGDGCVYFKSLKFADRKNLRHVLQSVFSCGTFDFLVALRGLLHKQGVQGGSLKKKKRGNELMLSHLDSVALFHLMYDTVPDNGLFLARKHKKYVRALRTLYGKNAVVA